MSGDGKYMLVLRYPALFFVGVFFMLGPAPFEQVHLAEANQAWAHIKPATASGSNSGSKPLPVRPPVHDPSTCIICAMLHAPLTAQQAPPMALAPTALVGYSPDRIASNYSPRCIAAEQCRGPPAA
jgi:hypothetical protein